MAIKVCNKQPGVMILLVDLISKLTFIIIFLYALMVSQVSHTRLLL